MLPPRPHTAAVHPRPLPRTVLVTSFLLIGAVLLSSCATELTRSELAAEYVAIGNAYLELGESERAAEYLVRAVDLDPSLRQASFNLAKAYIDAGRPREALEILEELRIEDPHNTLLLRTAAYAHYLAGDDEAARSAFLSALEENERDVDSLFNLALLDREDGDQAGALARLERARELDSGEDIARLYALVLTDLGRYEEAEPLLADLPDEQTDEEVLEAIAVVAEERAEYAQAIEAWQDVAGANSERAEPHFRIARIRLAYTDEEEAGIAALRQAIERGFNDAVRLELLLSDLDGQRRELVESLLIDEELLPEDDPES